MTRHGRARTITADQITPGDVIVPRGRGLQIVIRVDRDGPRVRLHLASGAEILANPASRIRVHRHPT